MHTLGANLGQFRQFPFPEAATIGGLIRMLSTVVGMILAKLLPGVFFPFRHTGWHSQVFTPDTPRLRDG
jgi:hypothetical protein